MCWGGNFNGEVGDVTIIHRNTPVNTIGVVSLASIHYTIAFKQYVRG